MDLTVTISWNGTTESATADQGDAAVTVFQVVGPQGTAEITQGRAAIDAVTAKFNVSVGSPLGGLSPLVCRSMVPRPLSPVLWEVIASYDVPAVGNYTPTTSPLLLGPRYEWKDCVETEPFDRDVTNNPVTNSAGDPPKPPPTKTITKEVLRVHVNKPFYDRATFKAYKDTVNSDTVTFTEPNGNENVFPPGFMKCVTIEPEKAYYAADLVVPIVFTFEVYDTSQISLDDPFQLHLLDEGYSGWTTGNTSGGSPARASFYVKSGSGSGSSGSSTASDYAQVTDPVLLDGTGKPINSSYVVDTDGTTPVSNPTNPPAGATVENAQGNAAVYLVWTRYKKVPFAPLFS